MFDKHTVIPQCQKEICGKYLVKSLMVKPITSYLKEKEHPIPHSLSLLMSYANMTGTQDFLHNTLISWIHERKGTKWHEGILIERNQYFKITQPQN